MPSPLVYVYVFLWVKRFYINSELTCTDVYSIPVRSPGGQRSSDKRHLLFEDDVVDRDSSTFIQYLHAIDSHLCGIAILIRGV